MALPFTRADRPRLKLKTLASGFSPLFDLLGFGLVAVGTILSEAGKTASCAAWELMKPGNHRRYRAAFSSSTDSIDGAYGSYVRDPEDEVLNSLGREVTSKRLAKRTEGETYESGDDWRAGDESDNSGVEYWAELGEKWNWPRLPSPVEDLSKFDQLSLLSRSYRLYASSKAEKAETPSGEGLFSPPSIDLTSDVGRRDVANVDSECLSSGPVTRDSDSESVSSENGAKVICDWTDDRRPKTDGGGETCSGPAFGLPPMIPGPPLLLFRERIPLAMAVKLGDPVVSTVTETFPANDMARGRIDGAGVASSGGTAVVVDGGIICNGSGSAEGGMFRRCKMLIGG